MPLKPAPIQQALLNGNAVTPIWAKWFDSIFRQAYVVPSYAKADLPTGEQGQLVFVTNEVGGAVLAFNDGTNWRRVTDRAIVS